MNPSESLISLVTTKVTEILEEAIAQTMPEMESELLTLRARVCSLEESRDFFVESARWWETQAKEIAKELSEEDHLRRLGNLADLDQPLMASEVEGDCKNTISPQGRKGETNVN